MTRKLLIYILSFFSIAGIVSAFYIYNLIFGPGIRPPGNSSAIYIPDGASYAQAVDSVESNLEIRNLKVFEWVARKKGYPELVKPGKYVIDNTLSYNELINILRSGKQTPVRITFGNVRSLNDLAGKFGGQLEVDSAQILAFLSDPENYRNDGFKREDVISASSYEEGNWSG
jgi:UPF0755 protein